jgi:hypothetical protein
MDLMEKVTTLKPMIWISLATKETAMERMLKTTVITMATMTVTAQRLVSCKLDCRQS